MFVINTSSIRYFKLRIYVYISMFPTLLFRKVVFPSNFSFPCMRKIIWERLVQKWDKKMVARAHNPGLCFHFRSFAELWAARCWISVGSCGCECCAPIGWVGGNAALSLVDCMSFYWRTATESDNMKLKFQTKSLILIWISHKYFYILGFITNMSKTYHYLMGFLHNQTNTEKSFWHILNYIFS